eukprot:767167-Hanusia_phi.AAC.2
MSKLVDEMIAELNKEDAETSNLGPVNSTTTPSDRQKAMDALSKRAKDVQMAETGKSTTKEDDDKHLQQQFEVNEGGWDEQHN